MKIGIDASCWSNPRGYGRFTRELLKAMIALEPEHQYIFFIDAISRQQCQFPEGVEVITIPTTNAATRAASAAGYRSPTDMFRMGKVVSRTPLDILFYPSVYTYFPARTSGKTIITFHDVIAELYPQMVFPNFRSRLFWSLKTWLARFQADSILTVSNFSRDGIIKYFRVSPDRVVVTVEAADNIFYPITSNKVLEQKLQIYHLTTQKPYFLYVGGIAPHKNLKVLIQAFQRFLNLPGKKEYQLVIVGDYEADAFWMDAEIQSLAHHKSKLDKIIFTGFVPDEDLPYLYSGAEALIFPSFCEGFGLPALEAMACGTPVIASNTTSLPEVVGDAGLFFNPSNPEDLANTMCIFADDKDLRIKLKEKAIKRAGQYSWEKGAQIVLNLMQELKRKK
ncbi:MAG: glycosyltransferase family 1 protein [Calditrichaeota bacterium]|nr:MAG: glycosyltransferase family 1 protein [Calditrichota bacterium]